MNVNGLDSSIPQHATLVVILRRPQPGIGKQRIAADIGADLTFELAECLLATTVEDADAWPGPVVLAPESATDAVWARDLLARPSEVIPQPAGNLGQRINGVDGLARAAGHTHLIYIGSDAPVLNRDYYGRVPAALTAYDVVLGPADDGGVTLMGSRATWPSLGNLPWSSHELGNALELACRECGLTVYRLGSLYDVDLATDLPRLCEDLAMDHRPARKKLRAWLIDAKLNSPEMVAQHGTGTGTR